MPKHDVSDQTIECEICRSAGPLHYRVRTRLLKTWTLVCPTCWPTLKSQPDYQYGGTRKANRRSRRR
ncbi:MAG: hypothetical protein CMN94_10365 [Synechococcus sp. EAC657]|nr:hypothetical protein [Synechococcus sp. EAC657]